MRMLTCLLASTLLLPATARAQDAAPLTRAVATAFTQDPLLGHPFDRDLQRLEAERRAAQERADRDRLNWATAVFVGTAGADWAVTAACFKVRCSEHAGHSASFFVGGDGFRNAGTAAALGLGLDAAIVLLAREVIAPDHPKLARGVLWVASGVRVVILSNKVGDLRAHAVRTNATR